MNYHIVSTPDGWNLQAEGFEAALLAAPTKARLLELLSEYMDGRTGSVKIYTETGKIEDERTYPRTHF
ncbi:DUF2188 domain-containing protein [Pseudomonas sp. PS01303]|uniref:DUF2188 domain-containing protein n=1 Tax=Pseudomonas sp. PS01303 TaxID=2991439 RepID=UPI00249B0568|nr:DUF2188 domain-containing protein [Pseudomonas sp. PS01303]